MTRQKMMRHKLTQDALAKLAGLSQQAVGRLLKGDRRGDPASWQRVLEALELKLVAIPKGTDVKALIEGKE